MATRKLFFSLEPDLDAAHMSGLVYVLLLGTDIYSIHDNLHDNLHDNSAAVCRFIVVGMG